MSQHTDTPLPGQAKPEQALPTIRAYTDCLDDLCPRTQTLMLVMRDLLQLVPIIERTSDEEGRDRVLVGVGERDSLEPLLAITAHPADAYSAMLTVLERMGFQLQAVEWRG